ncbi:MAG: hypothetical protein HKP55_10335 [Gammaproteobacteria bacterium]|nr:hypothetical protein [Gammaproteobacteria bacterium]
MEISNNPAITLIPSILGERNTSQVREIEQTADKKESSSFQLDRVITEADKRSAQQELESNLSQNQQQTLSREQPLSTPEQRAINAYVENDQEQQKQNLSDVLGIDVYS